MRQRLYFLLQDTEAAHEAERKLLLSHVDDKHFHFMAKDEDDLQDLPLVDFVHRSDLIPSMGQGIFYGGLTGTLVGMLIYMMPSLLPQLQMGSILFMGVAGGVLGVWIAGMVGISIPNSRLKRFEKALERGHILLIVDIPEGRKKEITRLLNSEDGPDAKAAGLEPGANIFP
ncbi:MAG: hypothetical protein R3F02_07000 [Thiolinea sp.]